MAGVKYGLLLASLLFVLGTLAPQPAGSIVFWTALSVHAVFGLGITWRRLRLPSFSAGGLAALFVCLAMISISARRLNLATIATELPTVRCRANLVCRAVRATVDRA